MNFHEAMGAMKDGKVCSFHGTEVRLVKVLEEYRGENLSTSWKFQNKDGKDWAEMKAINTHCLLLEDWQAVDE